MSGPTTPQPQAFLDIRVLPWRPRLRVPSADALREADFLWGIDDLPGLVIGLAMTLVVFVAAPVLAVVIALILLPFEVWLVVAVAVVVLVARFCGLTRWSIITADGTLEQYRWLPTALSRVRTLNGGRPPAARWHWA